MRSRLFCKRALTRSPGMWPFSGPEVSGSQTEGPGFKSRIYMAAGFVFLTMIHRKHVIVVYGS